MSLLVGSETHFEQVPNKLSDDDFRGFLLKNSTTYNTKAIYLYLTSEDICVQHDRKYVFCEEMCAYHASVRLSGFSFAYAFAGRVPADICDCGSRFFRSQKSPNGDIGLDTMMNNLAHQIAEAIVNPYPVKGFGWWDAFGKELGDKCAWHFGNVLTTDTGARFNYYIGKRRFLLQNLWAADRQGCEQGRKA